MEIAVIGAGNGGQAISGFLGMCGHRVSLYDRDTDKIERLKKAGGIRLTGQISGFGKVAIITDDLPTVVRNAELIMIATTANAHRDVAEALAPWLNDGQTIILNPGRTGGALEFDQVLKAHNVRQRIYLAEAQTLMYACRIVEDGTVNIIGVKDKVLVSALPASDTDSVIRLAQPLFPCFCPTDNVLRTSLENIGAMFHPCVLLFNAATIERKNEFYFYRDMTPKIADFIEKFDAERLAVGKAYGLNLIGVSDWISTAYAGTVGNNLCEKMRNNPGYHDIKSPSSIYTRQLMEDIPMGVIPIMELGKALGVEMRLFESMTTICSSLLDIDFYQEGRTLESMGIDGLSKDGIIKKIS